MTTIERFQRLQVELVRAGFATELQARPSRDKAVLAMYVELQAQTANSIEMLDALAGGHGFSYTAGENSRAAIVLAGE
jgi:hypothetical protein